MFSICLALFFQTAFATSPIIESVTEEKLSLGQAYLEITPQKLSRSENLGQVLAQVPGFSALSSGPTGQLQSLSFRGAKSEHLLVIVEGVVMNDLASPAGAFDFSSLPTSLIERVYVYKRGQAVRWGAGALSGAIEIFLKKKSPQEFGIGYGSFETQKVHFAKENLALAAATSAGYSSADDSQGQHEADGSSQVSVLATPNVGPWQSHFYHQQKRNEYDSFAGPGGDDPNAFTNSRQSLASLRFQETDSSLRAQISQRWLERNENNQSDPVHSSQLQAHFGMQKTDLSVETLWRSTKMGALLSAEKVESQVETAVSFESYQQSEVGRSVWAIHESVLSESLKSEVGVRLDSQNKNQSSSWKAGLQWLWRNWTSAVELDQAYKFPSVFQRFSSYGIPSLAAEKSNAFNWSVGKNFQHWGWEIEYFDRRFSDLIEFDLNTFKYRNLSRVQTSGVALMTRSKIEDLAMNLSITSLTAKHLESKEWLLRRPFLTAEFEIEKPLEENLVARFRSKFHGERDDLVNSIRRRVGSNTRSDLSLIQSWPSSELQFDLLNLFRERAPLVWGYTEPDLHFNLGYTRRF